MAQVSIELDDFCKQYAAGLVHKLAPGIEDSSKVKKAWQSTIEAETKKLLINIREGLKRNGQPVG